MHQDLLVGVKMACGGHHLALNVACHEVPGLEGVQQWLNLLRDGGRRNVLFKRAGELPLAQEDQNG